MKKLFTEDACGECEVQY